MIEDIFPKFPKLREDDNQVEDENQAIETRKNGLITMSRKNELGEVPTHINEPSEVRTRKWLFNADQSLSPEYDLDLGGNSTAPVDNAAHDTYVDLVAEASMPAGLILHLKALCITNDEAYKVKVEIFDDETLIYEITLAATSSFGLSKDDLVGVQASTSLRFKTQVLGAEAYSVGTSVNAGYYYRE